MNISRRDVTRLIGCSFIAACSRPAFAHPTIAFDENLSTITSGSMSGIKVISASDPRFAHFLETRLPGLSEQPTYLSTFRHSVVIQNDSPFPLGAYAVTWIFGLKGRNSATIVRRYAYRPSSLPLRHTVTGSLPALHPGEIAFATPFFAISETRMRLFLRKERPLPVVDLVRQKKILRIARQNKDSELGAELSGIILNGSAFGPAGGHLAKHYCLCRNAEHDLASIWKARYSGTGYTAAQILSDIENDVATFHSHHYRGRKGIYNRAQLRYACQLRHVLQVKGSGAFVRIVKHASSIKIDSLEKPSHLGKMRAPWNV